MGRGDDRTEGGTHAAREGRNTANNRSDQGPNRRAYTVDKARAIGSATMIREDRSGRKARTSSMVDRMEPTVREHTADMADWEATMVHVERMGLLEVEDEVGQSR